MLKSRALLFVCLASAILIQGTQSQCPIGSAKLQSGQCGEVDYIEGCLTYSAENKCSACEFNYDLLNERCDYNPKDQARCCSNFLANTGECIQCKSGLFLQDGACKQATIAGCILKTDGTCLNCALGFYLKNGRCLQGVKQCVSYDQNGNCLLCKQNYKFNGTACIRVIVKGCRTIDNNSLCTNCYPPFILSTISLSCQIPYCEVSDDFGCLECSDGYFEKDRACAPHIKGCQIEARGYCAYCNNGLVLDGDFCVSEGCAKFNKNTSECESCAPPFVLNNKICQIKNCLVYRNKSCVGCEVGYRLNQGQCLSVPLNEFEVCRSCAAKFFLGKDQQCSRQQPGCSDYSAGVCTNCNQPFQLANGACILDGCQILNQQGCANCIAPYTLDSSTKLCRLRFCIRAKNRRCLSCQSGYSPNADGVCSITDINCVEVNTIGICSRCSAGFHIEATGCVKDQLGCSYSGSICTCIKPFKSANGNCEIEGCTNYFTNGCTSCNTQSYYLSGLVCVRRAPGCIYQSGVCVKCIEGFSLDNGQCVIEGCDAYVNTPTGGCSACASPYQLINKFCRIQNCVSTKSRKCVTCANGFVVSQAGTCIKVITRCAEYSQDRCSVCQNGCYLSASGSDCLVASPGCIYSNGQCNSCINNYSLRNKRCFENDPNCLSSNDNGECLNCRSTFYIDQSSGRCNQGDINCEQFNRNGTCKQCKFRFYINSNGGCTQTVPGCVYQDSRCVSCTAPFNYIANTCSISGCDRVSYDGCVNCVYPFTLANFSCKLKNCLKTDSSRCVQCESGYLLVNGECQTNDGRCLTWSPEGVCRTCKKGYALNGDKCQFVDENCARFVNNGIICQECDAGYSLGSNSRCSRKAEGCNIYQDGVCKECVPKYYLWMGICFPFVQGCLRVEGKDCVQCENIYEVRKGICVKKSKAWSIPTIDTSNLFSFTQTSGVAPTTLSSKNFANASTLPLIKFEYSSILNNGYSNYSINGPIFSPYGWRSLINSTNEWVGFKLSRPQTFYKVIVRSGDNNAYVTKFVVSFRVSSIDSFEEIPTIFDSSALSNGQPLTLEFSTPVQAIQIRIIIKSYVGWPAIRFDFLYNNIDQTMEWSGINNIDEIEKKIMGTAITRLDIMKESNGRFYMVPGMNSNCKQNKSSCYAKAEFCAVKLVTGMKANVSKGSVSTFVISYSLDGLAFICYNSCKPIQVTPSIKFNQAFKAKEVKINLGEYTENAQLDFSFDTQTI